MPSTAANDRPIYTNLLSIEKKLQKLQAKEPTRERALVLTNIQQARMWMAEHIDAIDDVEPQE